MWSRVAQLARRGVVGVRGGHRHGATAEGASAVISLGGVLLSFVPGAVPEAVRTVRQVIRR